MTTALLIILYALIGIAVSIAVYHKTPVMPGWLKVVLGIVAGALWPLIALAFLGMAVAMAAPFQL